MKTSYHDIDIHFSVENVKIHALNIVFELFTRTIPTHSHGNHCYEIHYIPAGYGKLVRQMGSIMTYRPILFLSRVPTLNMLRHRFSQIPCRNIVFI